MDPFRWDCVPSDIQLALRGYREIKCLFQMRLESMAVNSIKIMTTTAAMMTATLVASTTNAKVGKGREKLDRRAYQLHGVGMRTRRQMFVG